ncbi:apotyrosinase chaperone MelC1 [Streptomyces albireticuli]|uniref:Tyrosinase n=1 Tax=Streptomyces albireticuli TaxID=1940 RepID=A0A2A2D871_9ACTN|nr:tyrosinase cofactor [Streptomyces albireticuli]MCD9141687.1 tyrosinase cofactor [Streptomyces albireticuli]MCD9164062.1 tyrosinase cofactor [Streptomyces albireticuli]MCD9189861.1 tyrosinase cofactor [Streptomyces albireticuli]PAU47701.1 tyrosinase [Streptomyces albireticuli]
MSSNVTRRLVLRGTAVAVAGAALAAPTAMAATRTATAAMTDHSGHGGHSGPAAFDEVYQGRRIVGKPATGEHAAHGGFTASIDGKELHLMQNADGTWISVVNHYETFATPLAVTRAAVDKLRGATLVPIAT